MGTIGMVNIVNDYYRRVVLRAWADTARSAGPDSWDRALWKAVVALLVVGLIGYFGGTQDLQSGMIRTFATMGAFAVVFLVFFLWYLFAAPAKMDLEAHKNLLIAQNELVSFNERLKPRTKIFLENATNGVTVSPTVIQNTATRGPPSKWVQFCVACLRVN
jgi:hypothetical protein